MVYVKIYADWYQYFTTKLFLALSKTQTEIQLKSSDSNTRSVTHSYRQEYELIRYSQSEFARLASCFILFLANANSMLNISCCL